MQPPSEPKTDSLQADQQPASPPDPMATTGSLEPAKVAALLADLDLNDSHSVLFFGSAAQEQLTSVSDSMLERVRTKDVGPAGEALNVCRKARVSGQPAQARLQRTSGPPARPSTIWY